MFVSWNQAILPPAKVFWSPGPEHNDFVEIRVLQAVGFLLCGWPNLFQKPQRLFQTILRFQFPTHQVEQLRSFVYDASLLG